MPKFISGRELQRCLSMITGTLPEKFAQKRTAKAIFQKHIGTFIEENRDRFSAKGSSIDSFEADAAERFTEYYNRVRHYVEEDLSGPLEMIYGELLEAGLDYEDCKKVFIEIRDIVRNFLLEIFVTNQTDNFEELIQEHFRDVQWPAHLKMPHLRRKSPALYDTFLKILKENIAVLRDIYMDIDIASEDSVYRTALDELFSALEKTAEATKTDRIVEEAVDVPHPPHIFRDRESFLWFLFMHDYFVIIKADLAFLYRVFEKKKLIIAKDTVFRDWYNEWINAKFEAVQHFKTWDRLKTEDRIQRFKSIVSKLAFCQAVFEDTVY